MSKAKVISALQVRKTIEWGSDVFGREVMALSEVKGERLEHQIVFDEFEQMELYRMLDDRFPQNKADDGELESQEAESSEEEPKYLILETRQNGGKKRTVLNWCENTAEAIDTLMTIWKQGDMSTLTELEEKVKIVRYSDLVSLTEIWEGPEEDEG